MKTNKRQLYFRLKSIDEGAKTVVAYVSTFAWDRMEERFAKGAWMLDSFKQNPVVLWAHRQDQLPVGKALKIQEDEFGLLAEMQFDTESEFAMQVFSLLQRGFLSTFSVGFLPKKWVVEDLGDGSGRRGFVWTQAELLEFSVVPVPANPGAVLSREDAELVVKTVGGNVLTPLINSEADSTNSIPVDGVPDEKMFDTKFGGYRVKEVVLPENEPFTPEQEEKPKETNPTPQESDFKMALKSISDMAKIKSWKPLDESSLALVKSTLAVLNEIVSENIQEVNRDELLSLKEIVQNLGEFVKKTSAPDYSDLISKILMQIEVSTRNGNR